MFRVINILSIIRYVAILTTIFSICTYAAAKYYLDDSLGIIKIASIAPSISFFLIFLITTGFFSRNIWRIVRKFNKSLFPDLNGTWEGEIITERNLKIPARALIKQTLVQTWIYIHTESSKSLTLESTPAIDCGQFKVYYIYKSIPKNTDWPIYMGSTIFDVRIVSENSENFLELSGYYFTDRKSTGRVRFRQMSERVDDDVSFY